MAHREFALEVPATSIEAIAEAVLELVDEGLQQRTAAHLDAELARRATGGAATEWLSVNEVAALLGVHTRTIYRALTDGRLAGTRVGAAWRVRRDDLDTWLSEPRERRPRAVTGARRPPAPTDSFRARAARRGPAR